MSSHDKRHGGYRGGAQGHGRHGDGFGDASGFMDETDREVSSLTDRAFRSLCIGEEAVYNDSSPVERHKAFADEARSHEAVKGSAGVTLPRGVGEPYGGEAAGTWGAAPTLQRFVTDEAAAKQEHHALAGDCVSHHSNGVIEATWQQKRTSSLIGAFGAAEYDGNGGVAADAAVLSQDSVYQHGGDPWGGSALLSIQKELSEFSSVYHQSIKGSTLTQNRNHFRSSEVAAAPQIPSNAESSVPSSTFLKSSSRCSSSFKTPSTRNFFLHSEFSPFQTWKEYNRLLYDRDAMPHVPSTSQSPRWYDSPFYRELTVAHRAQMVQLEEQGSHRKQYDNVLPAEPPASAVWQKASAIEKRSESEVSVNCPPWKRRQEPVKNQNRPCTASPLSDKLRRKEDVLVSTGRASATSLKVQTVADEQTSNSGTPFSISQLLTPTIHPRQETETSEILQYALSPSVLDPPLSPESDPRPTPEVKPRNKYKAMASSLLFNLKDNRKRVKSTYTPTMFKSTEIADHSKQPSQLDSLTGKEGGVASDTPLSWTGALVRSNVMDLQSVHSPVAQNTKTHAVTYVRRAEGSRSDDYLTLISPKTVREASSYRSFSHTPQESGSFRDRLAEGQGGRHVDSKSNETPGRKRPDPSSWKAGEFGSQREQDTKYKAPETQGLPQPFHKRDVPTSRVNEQVGNARTGEQYDYKLEADANLVKNNTSNERGVFQTEKVSMIGDIAALLERDRQLLEAQRGNTDRQNALVSGEKHSYKNEFFANTEKGNAKQDLTAIKEKQHTQNELFRKNEEIPPRNQVEVLRQNPYGPNEGLNRRQDYRHINQGLYDAQENYRDNLAASKGLHPTREIQYTPNEAFGRKEQAKQAVPVTRENKPVRNEFVVKEQDGIYQGQARQRIPSRTDDRNGANYTFVINQHEKGPAQDLSQRLPKYQKHPSVEAFAVTDLSPSKQAQAASEKNATSADETANRVKQVLPPARGVRYAPIEEFARKDRELEKQRHTAGTGEAKHEPVKVQTLIKQYEGSLGESRNGAKGLFVTGELKEIKGGGMQERYANDVLSVTVPERGKVLRVPLDGAAPSDAVEHHRRFNADPSAASEWERSAKDLRLSRQSRPVRNEALSPKGHEAVPAREKAQTRQEILTSKLKAHAEKEIFAIKEKGHAQWEAHVTKQKEVYMHGSKEGEPLSAERVTKNAVPVDGNRLAKQDSVAVRETHCRNGASVTQRDSPSADHIKSVITGDGEKPNLAKPAATTREKEHSRNYIIAKTEKISIRQEELQSIARAKIEAIAGNRIHQPKRAAEETHNAHQTSPSSRSRDAENITTAAGVNVSQAEEEDADKKEGVHAVEERDKVKMEGLPESREDTRTLGTAVEGTHEAKALNVLLNKEMDSVSQAAFMSAEHTANEPEKQQLAEEIFSRREREGDTSDAPVNKEAVSSQHPMAEYIENKAAANHEKHRDGASPVTIEKEHARNYLFVSEESVAVRPEVPPSLEHIRGKNTIANNETRLVREVTSAVEEDQDKNETAALHETNQVRLDSLASTKSETAENVALGIKIRLPEEEVPPETNAKMEAIAANQRQDSTCEVAKEDRGSVMHELPRSLETENRVSETLTISENPPAKPVAAATRETEDDKNDALAEEERISLKQDAPLLVQPGNKTFAVQESDVSKRVEKERAENVVQSNERDFLRQEGPSVEHIRIKIISHDEIPQVSESIFAIDSYSKHQTGSLGDSQQVKLDSLASREREQAEHDRPRNTEGLGVKQEELPPVARVESEVLAISESLQDQPEPENRHREHAEIEISQSVEKPDMKEEKNVVNDNRLVKPETVATKEAECDRNDELAKKEKTSVGEDAPPSVEHIRIKIIPHDANQPVSEKIVSVESKSVSLHENHQFKLDSLQSGKSESPENNAAGIPERIRFESEELSPKTSAEVKAIAATQRHEPVNKDRDTLVQELLQSVEKVNAATAFNENGRTEPEAVAPRETEGKRCDEERIDAREEVLPPAVCVTHEAAAEEETRGDEQGIAGRGQKDQAKSCAPVSKEKVSFEQDEPSVKHNRIQIVPVDETLQVRDSAVAIGEEHSIHETTERLQAELDSRVGTTNGSAEKNALGSRERVGGGQEEYPSLTINESNAVKENHRPENEPERMGRKDVVNQAPTSREEGSIKNETAADDETRLPEPEVPATRETKGAKAESLAKKETVDLGWDVPLSLESPEEEAIQINENHPVILEVRDAGGKEHAKSDVSEETNKRDTTVDKEKKMSDGQDEFSSVAHVKAGVKANHQPKHELASKVTDSVREELPQPTEDEKEITATLQKGGVVVNEKHKGKQEVLPTRKIEFAEDVLTNNKTDSVKREEKVHIQKETSSFNKNDQVSPGAPAGRREHSGSFEHANKEEVNAGEEERSSTQLIKTTAIGELHQAKQDLEKTDRVNVTQERAPAGEREYLGNKTIAVTENHLATREVNMTGEGDAKNAAVMNKGRDGVKVHVLPVKENERPRSVRSVTDKIHQAVLANRNGNSDSPPKTKSDMDESIAGVENHKHKKEVLSTRERAHAQNQPILFDENLKLKLEALARRRKEKVERYTRANSDGMNTRQGEHASTPHAKTGTRIVDKNYLAKHGLVIDDTGRITYGIPSREKENIRNVTTAASGSPLAKMEASAVSNKEHGEKDTLITGEAAGVRRREPVPRDGEHGQNEMLDIGDHRVKHTLENKQIGRSNRAPLRSESMRNESASASDNDQAKMEALAMSQKQDTRNFGVTNKVGDRAVTSKNETVIGSVNHKGNQGLLGTQVEKDSDRHGRTNTERIEDRHDVVSQREKENYEKQVTEKEKQRLRMEMRSKEGEYPKSEVFPGKRSNIRQGELSASEKGPTILDYLLEKDKDRSTLNKYEIKEIDTIKQEVHATKGPTKKEVLALKKEELIKNEGFARRGNAIVSNMATKDREVAENKESGGKEIDSVPPEVLVRKYEVPAENTFTVRDAHQTKQVTNEAVVPQKEDLFSRQYQSLSENLKEHSAHKVLVTEDHPKLEATATTSSSKQEMVLTKEREPIRKELFAVKGKGETAVDRLSTKDTDHTKTKERADRGKNSNRQEVLMEQYQNLSENICIIQDKDLSKSAPDSMKEKEHSKQVIISSREDARRQPLAKTGNAHAKPEIFSAHENVHTHPEVYAITDKARYHSGKEALVSPQIQGYYSKHPMPVSDERGNSHTRNVVPRANSKTEMEALSNTQNEIKETLPLREEEREVIAMREHRAKERAVARQKQQHYEKEALPRQEYATYKTLPIKEKTDMRHELPPQFEKEDTKKEALANNLKDRTEIAARNQPNRNIEGQIIHEPHNRYTAPPSLPLQANGWRGAPISSQPMGHINVPSRESYLTVGDASQSPEEEYKTHPSLRSAQSEMAKGPGEMKVVEVKRNMGRPGEALQYYAINNHERNLETDRPATSSHGHERTPRIEPGGLVHAELYEGGLAPSLMDYTKAQIPTTRSNTSSPSLGKPLFKVKDNSLRGSPMTKTVKPSFHKTFADDQRLGSSQENLSVLDQGDEERDHLREHVDVPALHNTAAASSRISRSRELPSQHSLPAPDFTTARAIQAHNILSTPEFTTPREQPAHSVVPTTGFISAREPRGYYRRNRRLDEDGRNSVISTMSEDLESCGTSTYLENPCERPESACSDLRPLGKPPTVPPKSEKALRRAKRLTTRRIKRAEVTGNVEGPGPGPGPSLGSVEHKPLRAVASMPSSPTEVLVSRRPAPAQPALPQYCVEPGYGPRAPSLVAQPFPLTQRKLLQDPNSGQFFVVDMPVQVKTKMFFDPETGKYVQLSVRQSPDGARSNASSVELLSPPPYVLYPGFLPVPVSSLPPLRSASQMSAPAALMEDQEKRSDPWRQEAARQNCGRKPEPYIEPAYRSRDQPVEKPTHGDERGCTSQRNLNIIPMGELEDFAMESA
ncbi:uncharacterized protein LOC118218315 [Anguilla anguilla]|uniref:uncharacterized protein LOC118218315 n=1 Tax=Anguilla anguilla TaxID=7936 RepID=UPI0015AA8606|nr:uncharacterized protein LOC118218315 [Anguilla anguilla]